MFYYGGVLAGISIGIKTYNVAFCIFAVVHVILTIFRRDNALSRKIRVFLEIGIVWGIGIIAGVLIANPLILLDFGTFHLHTPSLTVLKPTIGGLYTILMLYNPTWDVVNTSGIDKEIISIAGIYLLFLTCFYTSGNRINIISAFVPFLFLTLLFWVSSFQGWYYMPVIFLFCLCVDDKCKFMSAILVLNLALLSPYLFFQMDTKWKTYQIELQRSHIASITERYHKSFPAYEITDYLQFSKPVQKRYYGNGAFRYEGVPYAKKQLMCISAKVKQYSPIMREKCKMAERGLYGYHMLYEDKLFCVVLYEGLY